MIRKRSLHLGGNVIVHFIINLHQTEVRHLFVGCWHNDRKRPVLKHGPRSRPIKRVFECSKLIRAMKVNGGAKFLLTAASTDPEVYGWI